nr:hypothetical protein [Streptomyces griseorubiginosus]
MGACGPLLCGRTEGRLRAGPRIAEVVAELSRDTREFAGLWGVHEAKSKSREGKRLCHPEVGDLHIRFPALTVNGAPHQQLVVPQAEPASATAAAFERLRATGASSLPVVTRRQVRLNTRGLSSRNADPAWGTRAVLSKAAPQKEPLCSGSITSTTCLGRSPGHALALLGSRPR